MPTNRPLPSPLPADLPEDWQDSQIVAPEGADVGLTEQHGYNYLMQQVNDAQRAANQLQESQTQFQENFQEDLEQKQDKITGTQGQVVGFDAQGNAVPQVAPSGGVTSFNGRTGAVKPQSGDYSVTQVTGAAPSAAPVFTGSISMGRKAGTAVGARSTATGSDTTASQYSSHAEGNVTIASGYSSHAEGDITTASGNYSHAEGKQTIASGYSSHAEGDITTASGSGAHAEGSHTTASGNYAHAEGNQTTASGDDSHAAGILTIANDYQYVIGTYNIEKSSSGVYDDRFIVGGGWGTRKNAFRVASSGACYGSGSWNTSGADYAELFEWADGNPDAEDRAGLFVTLDGDRIRIAAPEDDYILGIVSAVPSVVGDVYDDQWAGMYLRDVFGRTVIEEQDFPAETIEVPSADGVLETVEIHPAFRAPAPVVNPEYNHTEPYQPRTQRPEWDAVGLLGKLVAVDDGTCQVNGWATVGVGGVATTSPERTKYRIMARLDDTHVRVMIL